MREIKFRGIAVGFNKQAYGYYVNKNPEKHQIIAFDTILPVLVESNTVGQFTGLKDKSGVEIYEGDILSDMNGEKLVCEYSNPYLGFRLSKLKLSKDNYQRTYDLGSFGGCKHLEVIGNIYQNPELLKP